MKKSNENLSADRNILKALYEIGDSASKRIISIYPNLYPLDEKEDGYTALEIRNRYRRGWGIESGNERAFTINAGSFACKASYDNIYIYSYLCFRENQ